jgi:hypothetical protein
MKRFDFARAHAELAVPAYLSLSVEIRQLVELVDGAARDLKQDAGPPGYMPWPDGLRGRFDAQVSDHLAEASQVVYCYGHWGTKNCWQQHGTYWKFSNYADQVLRDRLMLDYKPLFERRDRWHSIGVRDGMLHLTQCTRDMFRSIAIGAAVHETVQKLQERVNERYFGRVVGGRNAIDSGCREVWTTVEALARECVPTGLVGKLLTAGDDYQVES